MTLEFKIIQKENLTESDIKTFADLLKEQGKVTGNLNLKADRCKFICLVFKDKNPIGIGGIKKKTKTDFNEQKAFLMSLENQFEWELGYLYTNPKFNGLGIASSIVKILINEYGEGNLMASTEINKNPAMVYILNKNGFKQYGNPWKSIIHSNYLGLFLKFN
ncbi:GNAT family N-acetyltransferase [Tenacibaculum dicentrarchi]|nr:GNAT family N-acetyltransferase [Tenacibaculum dicentrarchi]MCD8426023.1 GNAT family N-acetyltransferase [Tenacibaculum dicentrarchi]MCD8443260.1 GNAT family N-acetyltransferase [Tenacibaculum dicentrarchi]